MKIDFDRFNKNSDEILENKEVAEKTFSFTTENVDPKTLNTAKEVFTEIKSKRNAGEEVYAENTTVANGVSAVEGDDFDGFLSSYMDHPEAFTKSLLIDETTKLQPYIEDEVKTSVEGRVAASIKEKETLSDEVISKRNNEFSSVLKKEVSLIKNTLQAIQEAPEFLGDELTIEGEFYRAGEERNYAKQEAMKALALAVRLSTELPESQVSELIRTTPEGDFISAEKKYKYGIYSKNAEPMLKGIFNIFRNAENEGLKGQKKLEYIKSNFIQLTNDHKGIEEYAPDIVGTTLSLLITKGVWDKALDRGISRALAAMTATGAGALSIGTDVALTKALEDPDMGLMTKIPLFLGIVSAESYISGKVLPRIASNADMFGKTFMESKDIAKAISSITKDQLIDMSQMSLRMLEDTKDIQKFADIAVVAEEGKYPYLAHELGLDSDVIFPNATFSIPKVREHIEAQALQMLDEAGVVVGKDLKDVKTRMDQNLLTEAIHLQASFVEYHKMITLMSKGEKTNEEKEQVISFFRNNQLDTIEFITGAFKSMDDVGKQIQANIKAAIDLGDEQARLLKKNYTAIEKHFNKKAVRKVLALKEQVQDAFTIRRNTEGLKTLDEELEAYDEIVSNLKLSGEEKRIYDELKFLDDVQFDLRLTKKNYEMNKAGLRQIDDRIIIPDHKSYDQETGLMTGKDYNTGEELPYFSAADTKPVTKGLKRNPAWTAETNPGGFFVHTFDSNGNATVHKQFKTKTQAQLATLKLRKEGVVASISDNANMAKIPDEVRTYRPIKVDESVEETIQRRNAGIKEESWTKRRSKTRVEKEDIYYFDDPFIALNKTLMNNGNIPVEVMRDQVKKVLREQYGKYINSEDVMKMRDKTDFSDLGEWYTAKKLQDKLKALYSVDTPGEALFRNFLHNFGNDLIREGGLKQAAGLTVSALGDVVYKIHPVKAVKQLNAYMKLSISAAHFAIQPSWAFTIGASDPNFLKTMAKTQAITADLAINKALRTPISKWAQEYIDDLYQTGVFSNLKMNEVVDSTTKAGKFKEAMNLPFTPLWMGEMENRFIIGVGVLDEAKRLGLKRGTIEHKLYVNKQVNLKAGDYSPSNRMFRGVADGTYAAFMQVLVNFGKYASSLSLSEGAALFKNMYRAYGPDAVPGYSDFNTVYNENPKLQYLVQWDDFSAVYSLFSKDENVESLMNRLGFSEKEKKETREKLKGDKYNIEKVKLEAEYFDALLGGKELLSDSARKAGHLREMSSRMAVMLSLSEKVKSGYGGLVGPAIYSLTNGRTLDVYKNIAMGLSGWKNGAYDSEQLKEILLPETRKLMKETFSSAYNVGEGLYKLWKLRGHTDEELKFLNETDPLKIYHSDLTDVDLRNVMLSDGAMTSKEAFWQTVNLGNLNKKLQKKDAYELYRYTKSWKELIKKEAEYIAEHRFESSEEAQSIADSREAFLHYSIDKDNRIPSNLKPAIRVLATEEVKNVLGRRAVHYQLIQKYSGGE